MRAYSANAPCGSTAPPGGPGRCQGTSARRGSSPRPRAPAPGAARNPVTAAAPRPAPGPPAARRTGSVARPSLCLLDPLLQPRHATQPLVRVRGAQLVIVQDFLVRQDEEPALGHRVPQRVRDLLRLDRGALQHDVAGPA